MQANLHERLGQLRQLIANEVNSEYGSLFLEKKYKELVTFAKEQEEEHVQVFATQVLPLKYIIRELSELSRVRERLIKGSTD